MMTDSLEMKYNTTRPDLKIPEYGRNIQKMIDYAKTLEDKDERNKVAQAIIKVMGQVSPHLRDVEQFNHKLWAQLFIMSEFELDVDSPFPVPTKESFEKKPDPLPYPQNKIHFRHYGNTIQLFIDAISRYEEGEEKQALTKVVANLMKRTYLMYNRDSVEDSVIQENIKSLSNGKVTLDDPSCLQSTQEILKSGNFKTQGQGSKNNKRNNNNNKKNKNRNRKKRN